MNSFQIQPAPPIAQNLFSGIDEDAMSLLSEYGLRIDLPADHAFARSEVARWQRSAELGRAFLAVDGTGAALAFAALDFVDGEPYLDQLSVRRAAMRRGVGGALLALSVEWARSEGGSHLWLTTYAHLPFNRSYYERHGFELVAEAQCGADIRHHLDEQRRYLPAPEQRIAMRRRL